MTLGLGVGAIIRLFSSTYNQHFLPEDTVLYLYILYCTCTVLYCTVSHASATTKKGKVKVRRGTEVGSSSHERESSVHDHTPAIMTHHHRSSYYYHRASITLPHATSASMEHKFNVITDILIKQN
jgi:hypothetical protein